LAKVSALEDLEPQALPGFTQQALTFPTGYNRSYILLDRDITIYIAMAGPGQLP